MKESHSTILYLFILLYYNLGFAQSEQINGDIIPGGSDPQYNDTVPTGVDGSNLQVGIDNAFDYTASYIPTSIDIDRNSVVGEISLSSGTTPSGAKTYQVPIEIAPGMKGFQPNLALSYNSMQSYSPVGVGWRLEGVPQINRSGKNIYYHGKTEGIVMDNSDTFVLDGLTCSLTNSSSELKLSNLDQRDLIPGDLNGDGLTDLALSPEKTMYSTSQWEIYYSMGNGQFNKEICKGVGQNGSLAARFHLVDINGDGRSDLIRCDKLNIETYLMSDQGFLLKGTIKNPSDGMILIPVANTSRNTFASLLLLNNSEILQYSYSRNNIKDNLLTGAVNSLGVIEKNNYGFINNLGIESELYITGSNAVYPYINIVESVPVIASTETFLDDESINECEYQYTNAVVHRQGLGFCGFEKIKITDSLNGTVIREYEPFKFGMQKRETTPTSKITFNNRADVSSNKTYKLLTDRKEEENLLTGSKCVTSWNYNKYGYPYQEYSETSDELTCKSVREYVNYDDIDNNETGYLIGFVTSEEIEKTRNGSDTYKEKISIPTHSKGLPLSKVTYKDGHQIGQETYNYDSHGNLANKIVKTYSSTNANATIYTYDSYDRVLKETDHMGLSTQYAYNSQGLICKSINNRGNSTTFEYDSFGREKCTYNPDGTVRTFDYSWETTDNGGIYSITETSTGKPTEKKYYDAFNREVRSEQTRFDGSILKTDKMYDYKGNLGAESMPYKSESPTQWTTYDYDSYDRLIYRTEATGKRTSYDYSGSSVTEDDGIMQKIKDYNSAGELLSVSDSEGTVYFELGADGQKQRVVIDDGYGTYNLNTIYTYDKYHRLISVEDPSQGETVTAYDEEGNISSRTDAKGNSTEFEYDCFGRLIKKTFPEFVTTYTYNDYNELISQNSSNGTYKTFTYDELGRLISEKEAGGGAWLQKDYTYADGNVATIAHTSNRGKLTTEYYTYTNGHLTEVKISDGQSIYKLEEENDLGKPTRAVTGNVTRNYGYDEYGFPRFRAAASEDTEYQDEEYEFDTSRSNLYSRYDIQRGQWESFEYDTQNRLINYDGEYVSYDTNGNISEKSDIGLYQYENSAKPYAVTGVNPYYELDNSLSKEQNIEYTSFSRPSSIAENGYTARFEYNADGERVKMTIAGTTQFDRLERTYLGGCYECDDNGISADAFLEKLYLMGDYYSAPSVLFSGRIMEQQKYDSIPAMKGDSLISGIIEPIDPIFPINPLGLDSDLTSIRLGYFTKGKAHVYGVHQILRDYLGSITHVIKPDGTEAESLSYDAWGRVRLSDDGNRYLTTDDPPLYLGRGYTGHEHLPLFGLVNMNARLYDPLLGRFLSPDPYVAYSDWLQSYNRYSYALNNPFFYVDQNGEMPWIIICAAIGGTINVITHWDIIREKGFGTGVMYCIAGAAAGAAAALTGGMLGASMCPLGIGMAGTGVLGGAIIGGVSGITQGLVLGTANSLIAGSNITEAVKNGLIEAGKDGLAGAITGGIMGGVKASIEGRNIWSGKYSTETLLRKAGYKADAAVDGEGHVAGTKKHSSAKKIMERRRKVYKVNKTLQFEYSTSSETGIKVRFDVIDTKTNYVWDYKFGYPGMTEYDFYKTPQLLKYINNFPDYNFKVIHIP